MAAAPYNRILLKLSGEALMGDQSYGIDAATLALIANEIKKRGLDDSESLDVALRGAIREQAIENGFQFEEE